MDPAGPRRREGWTSVGLSRENERKGDCVGGVGASDGDLGPRGGGGIRDARGLEFHSGELVVWVPMVTWPMYAEQHLNAFKMAAEMGLAAEMAVDRRRDGWVTAEEVERKVRWLMEDGDEGRKVRERVKEMKAASREAVENGGLSWNELDKVVTELLNESGET
ncbi:hypothetical protein KFK09_015882 [Dendrobium nobile]|uniref:Uncharacterized protein n=1 Tax=Dendrobium nobile TaxID=94219 RepID=A0A8T3B7I3_DENNO|nr:hypothetical protein KFK09_015882 [Dendrobium nobile]